MHAGGNADGLFVPDLIIVWLPASRLAGASFVSSKAEEKKNDQRICANCSPRCPEERLFLQVRRQRRVKGLLAQSKEFQQTAASLWVT